MTDGWIMDAFGDGSDLPDDFGADLAPPGMCHVGSQPPYGFDGCGWLAGVDTYVRAEDYDRCADYTPDDYHLFADIARLTADLTEVRAALAEATDLLREVRPMVEQLSILEQWVPQGYGAKVLHDLKHAIAAQEATDD